MSYFACGVSSYVQAVAFGFGLGMGIGIEMSPCEPRSLCFISSDDGDDISVRGVPRRVRNDDTEVVRIAPASQLNYEGFLAKLAELKQAGQDRFITEHFEGHNDNPRLGPEYINTVISSGPRLKLLSVGVEHYDASFNPEAYARSPAEILVFAMAFVVGSINQRVILPTTEVAVVRGMHQGIITALQARDEAQDAYDWLHMQINAMGRRT